MATTQRAQRPQAKWKPAIKAEPKGKTEVKLEIPQDQYDALTAYGQWVLAGSSASHICLAAIALFVQNEVEPALASMARTSLVVPVVDANGNGKVKANQ